MAIVDSVCANGTIPMQMMNRMPGCTAPSNQEFDHFCLHQQEDAPEMGWDVDFHKLSTAHHTLHHHPLPPITINWHQQNKKKQATDAVVLTHHHKSPQIPPTDNSHYGSDGIAKDPAIQYHT
jgi:hypothetical protein